jgi:transposase
MRLETCIRKGLRLKSQRVLQVREELDRLVAEIEWISGRTLICSNCSRRTARIHARQVRREWRERSLVLRYAPVGMRCPACGPRVEHLPWAHKWQRITKALGGVIARLWRQLGWKGTATHYGGDWRLSRPLCNGRSIED